MSRGIPYCPIEPELIPVKVDTTELAAADSLAVASVQDSLQMAVADSMALAAEQSAAEAVVLDFTTFDAPVSEPATPYREATVEEVFGYGSVQAEIPFLGSTTPSPIATPAFGLLVLAIVAFYCLMLYQHLGDAVQLLGRVTRERASGERLSEDSNGDYSRFLTLCVILGVLLIGDAPGGSDVEVYTLGALASKRCLLGSAGRKRSAGRSGDLSGGYLPPCRSINLYAAPPGADFCVETYLFCTFDTFGHPLPGPVASDHRHGGSVLVLGDYHRVDYFTRFIPSGDTFALYFKKNFNFALDFVPLRRRNFPDQPVDPTRGEIGGLFLAL